MGWMPLPTPCQIGRKPCDRFPENQYHRTQCRLSIEAPLPLRDSRQVHAKVFECRTTELHDRGNNGTHAQDAENHSDNASHTGICTGAPTTLLWVLSGFSLFIGSPLIFASKLLRKSIATRSMLFLKNGWLALSSLAEKFTANNLVKSRPISALTPSQNRF